MFKKEKFSGVNIPYSSLRCLYRGKEGKVVCEIDLKELRRVNDGAALDDLIAEADFDFRIGRAEGPFKNVDDLMEALES